MRDTGRRGLSGQHFLPRAQLVAQLVDRYLCSISRSGIERPYNPEVRPSAPAADNNRIAASDFNVHSREQRAAAAEIRGGHVLPESLTFDIYARHDHPNSCPNPRLCLRSPTRTTPPYSAHFGKQAGVLERPRSWLR
jgi:hypothetical protein